MDREEALALLKQHLHDDYTLKHSIALEAIMRKLAIHFNQDQDKWGLTGLLHDIDWDTTKDTIENHSMIGADILEAEGFEEDIVYAVRCHNERHGLPAISFLDKCLLSADNLTGLITACALVQPDKKISSVKATSVMKKFKDKNFAAATDRDKIKRCEDFGLTLSEFIDLALKAMQEISQELGL